MAGNHFDACPGCNERTMYVHQMEQTDEKYCTNCGYEEVVKLERPRIKKAEDVPVLSHRDHRSADRKKKRSKDWM